MGTRVGAEIQVYPFDRDTLGRDTNGAAFLEALDTVVDDHESEEPEEEDDLLTVNLNTVNYGVLTFNRATLPQLATKAGLFYRQSDRGSDEWAASQETYLPDGRAFVHELTPEGGLVLTEPKFRSLAVLGPADGLADRVDAYFQLGKMKLPELAYKAAAGSLDPLLSATGHGPPEVTDTDLPQDVPDTDIVLDHGDPPAIRGVGSNQYQDKPPGHRCSS